MAGPTRNGVAQITTTTATMSPNCSVAPGDLIVICVMSADATPTLTVQQGNAGSGATVTLEGAVAGVVSLTGGVGGDAVIRNSGNGVVAHIFTVRVLAASTGIVPNVNAVMTGTWSGTARRVGLEAIAPGALHQWGQRSGQMLASQVGSSSSGSSLTLGGWSAAPPTLGAAVVLANARLGTATITVDFDGDGTKETTASAGLGGGRVVGDGCAIADAFVTAGIANVAIVVNGSVAKTACAAFLAPEQIIGVGLATETDTCPTAFSHKRAKPALTAFEFDDAWDNITTPGERNVRQVHESELVFPVVPKKARTPGMVTETDRAFRIAPAPSTVTETDIAFAIAQVTKTWSAELLLADPTAAQSPTELDVWARKANVVDTGDIRIRLKQGATTIATSSFAALTDTSTKYALTIPPGTTGGNLRVWWEVRTTNKLTANVSDVVLLTTTAIGRADETDISLSIATGLRRVVGRASEADAAFSITKRNTISIGRANEIDASLAVGHARSAAIARVLETESASPIVRGGSAVWLVGAIPI